MISSIQLAKLLGMSRWGAVRLMQKLNIPHRQIKHKIVFEGQGDFFASVSMVQKNPSLQVFYSVPQLAKLMGKSNNTIKSFLINHDFPIYYSGRKWLILLIDFQRRRAPQRHYSVKTEAK